MKVINKGDIFVGKDFVELVNNIIGPGVARNRMCGYDLDDYGYQGFIAWIVYMNGSLNGFENWLWKNYISKDEKYIYEQNIDNNNVGRLEKFTGSNGYKPLRFAFRRDPNGVGDKNKCEFLGLYKLVKLRDNGKGKLYKKISEKLILPKFNEVVPNLPQIEDVLKKDSIYSKTVKELGYTNSEYSFFINHNLTIYDLLSFEFDDNTYDLYKLATKILSEVLKMDDEYNEFFKKEFFRAIVKK